MQNTSSLNVSSSEMLSSLHFAAILQIPIPLGSLTPVPLIPDTRKKRRPFGRRTLILQDRLVETHNGSAPRTPPLSPTPLSAAVYVPDNTHRGGRFGKGGIHFAQVMSAMGSCISAHTLPLGPSAGLPRVHSPPPSASVPNGSRNPAISGGSVSELPRVGGRESEFRFFPSSTWKNHVHGVSNAAGSP